MSEIKKNIETCRGEDVLAEVSAAPQDPHFGSLVNEALDPLKQQALHQAGYDGYSEVIEQHKPYTFASAIIQMKSNLLLLLRALWQFPFGGTIRSLSDDASLRSLSDDASLRSLADMWQHYITRLQGNETYGIPSRLSSLTDLPSAPLLVSDRKISNGGAEDGIPDGMSLAHLLCSTDAANAVTEIVDDNTGWTMKNNGLTSLLAMLPAVTKAEIWCEYADESILADRATIKHLIMPYIKRCGKYNNEYTQYNIAYNCADLETIDAPELEEWYPAYDGGFGANCQKLTYINAKSLRTVRARAWFYARTPHALYMATALKKLIIGTPTGYFDLFSSTKSMEGCDNLIYLEICGDGGLCEMSFNIGQWSPTNALDASRTDLIEEGSTAVNNLQQFLQNFRTYIALRLADNGSGKTLTLSQAVYDAIKDESHLFVFDEGTMTIYAYLTNIKHWTVTK